MRIRSTVVAAAAALVVTAAGLVAFASPASAGCSGHNTHPDRFSAGGIKFGNGTAIRTGPHFDCARKGLGYPSHGIDVHCTTIGDQLGWLYVRDTTTGVSGWANPIALDYAHPPEVPRCT